MKLSNSLKDYGQEQLDEMGKKIQRYLEIIKEAKELISSELKNPSKSDDNVIYLNFHPITEFENSKEDIKPFHEVLDIYLEWGEQLFETIFLNLGNYNNHKVTQYIIRLYAIVASLQNFFSNDPAPKTSNIS